MAMTVVHNNGGNYKEEIVCEVELSGIRYEVLVELLSILRRLLEEDMVEMEISERPYVRFSQGNIYAGITEDMSYELVQIPSSSDENPIEALRKVCRKIKNAAG